MRCTDPKETKIPYPTSVILRRCGQCLPCRIRATECWTFRCLLESQHSVTSSFWTLTYDDQSLSQKVNYAEHIRKFWQSLRRHENQAGNGLPIRYFGLLEHGGTFGRPHYHFLIYNLQKYHAEGIQYIKGLPLPREHLRVWPYGHLLRAQYNPATVRYVLRYLTEFKGTSDLPTRPFRTERPAIGYYGLQSLAASIAKKHTTLPETLGLWTLGGKLYPMDRWARDIFTRFYIKHGGTIVKLSRAERLRMQEPEKMALEIAPKWYHERQEKRLRRYEQERNRIIGKAQTFEVAVSQRYIKRQQAKSDFDYLPPDLQVAQERFI